LESSVQVMLRLWYPQRPLGGSCCLAQRFLLSKRPVGDSWTSADLPSHKTMSFGSKWSLARSWGSCCTTSCYPNWAALAHRKKVIHKQCNWVRLNYYDNLWRYVCMYLLSQEKLEETKGGGCRLAWTLPSPRMLCRSIRSGHPTPAFDRTKYLKIMRKFKTTSTDRYDKNWSKM
jgi:hypothetical protein